MKVKLKDYVQFSSNHELLENVDVSKYVSTENLLADRNGVKFPASNLPTSKKISIYQKNDILISNIRPYFKKIWKADCTGPKSNDILAFRTTSSKLLQEYLYMVLQSDNFFDYVTNTSKGTKMPRGDKSAIRNYEFELPTIEYQRKISNAILKLEDKIKLNNRINDNLLELITLIWAKYSQSIDNKVPLKKLAKDIVTGKTPSTKIKENYGSDIPFVKIPDMHNKVFIDKTVQNLSLLGADSQKNKYLPANSIMVSCIGTPGLVSLTGSIAQTNQQINSLILDEKYTYWAFLELRSLSEKIGNLGSGGTTIKNLNKSDFGKLEIVVPNNDRLLNKFNSIAQPIFESIHTNSFETNKLNQLKIRLLNKYF